MAIVYSTRHLDCNIYQSIAVLSIIIHMKPIKNISLEMAIDLLRQDTIQFWRYA
jgi:hypothetical protein